MEHLFSTRVICITVNKKLVWFEIILDKKFKESKLEQNSLILYTSTQKYVLFPKSMEKNALNEAW